jgi:hypothetical protein
LSLEDLITSTPDCDESKWDACIKSKVQKEAENICIWSCTYNLFVPAKTIAQVRQARSKSDVKATSNFMPRSPIKFPASFASFCPCMFVFYCIGLDRNKPLHLTSPRMVRGISHQPVNRFSRFQRDSPCLIITTV